MNHERLTECTRADSWGSDAADLSRLSNAHPLRRRIESSPSMEKSPFIAIAQAICTVHTHARRQRAEHTSRASSVIGRAHVEPNNALSGGRQ